jgi:hypothetical protein
MGAMLSSIKLDGVTLLELDLRGLDMKGASLKGSNPIISINLLVLFDMQ